MFIRVLAVCLVLMSLGQQPVHAASTKRVSSKDLSGIWELESIDSMPITEKATLQFGPSPAVQAQDSCQTSYAMTAKVAKSRLILSERITLAKAPPRGCVPYGDMFRVLWSGPRVRLVGRKLFLDGAGTLVYRRPGPA
jgi:hypothetical protein